MENDTEAVLPMCLDVPSVQDANRPACEFHAFVRRAAPRPPAAVVIHVLRGGLGALRCCAPPPTVLNIAANSWAAMPQLNAPLIFTVQVIQATALRSICLIDVFYDAAQMAGKGVWL